MEALHKVMQKNKYLSWGLLLGYIIFLGCFTFPFSNELYPFDYTKAYLTIMGYGAVGIMFTGLLVKGRSYIVFILTLFFTIIGLICRYIIEYGEYSNSINFIFANIVLYLVIVPLYCLLLHWALYKWVANKKL